MAKKPVHKHGRTLDARPDTVDFRDCLYQPTLVEVLPTRPLADYRKWHVPILDQGEEGACTGFGLATVANYLLRRRAHALGQAAQDVPTVSPRMFYDLARRYDEWAGENYEGSSARGAIKGWHKHGACAEKLWKGRLTDAVTDDALSRPLGAYYRVNHKDLVAMHGALTEVGVLYVTSVVHGGWDEVKADGKVPWPRDADGAHAFAIVGYDEAGFWVQNSWGAKWGLHGFCHVTYDDWLQNGTDAWVVRLGAPVQFEKARTTARAHSPASAASDVYTWSCLRNHVVSIGNDGKVRTTGALGNDEDDVKELVGTTVPDVVKKWPAGERRVLLYAHGGLVSEDAAVQRVADTREALLDHHVYPLAFVWKTDYWTTLRNVLEDALRRRRPEGALDAARDFLLERLDDALEAIARRFTGRASWNEMRENATRASTEPHGAARLVVDQLLALPKDVEIHAVGHSAGSILLGPVVDALAKKGRDVASCTLWAPACTMQDFGEWYLPAIRSRKLDRFALFTLTDEAERDGDCARIYHKSLLYLVSHAFEREPRIPWSPDHQGVPLLGLAKHVAAHAEITALVKEGRIAWVQAPNDAPVGSDTASRARHHGDFDDDAATVKATLARILGEKKSDDRTPLKFERTASGLRDIRKALPG